MASTTEAAAGQGFPTAGAGLVKESRIAMERRRRVSSLDRVLQIWDHFQATGEPCTAYSFAKTTGAPLSTIYATIDALVERNLLVRKPDNTIWLGPRLHQYGLAYARSIDFLPVATEEMFSLCNSLRETIQVCGRDGNEMVVMAMADGVGHYRVTSNIGSRLPLNWTASGRLLIGWMDEPERQAIFSSTTVPSATGNAPTDVRRLSEAAREAFDARLAVQVGESEAGVACIASPIVDERGACNATISVVVPQFKLNENLSRYSEQVRRSARLIEIRLGWNQGEP